MADFIDRQALGIGKCDPKVFENKAYAEGWNSAISIIESAPAAKVQEVRHGKWIKRRSIYAQTGRFFECSCCGRQIEALSGELNYCPHCGAKMDGKGGEQNG